MDHKICDFQAILSHLHLTLLPIDGANLSIKFICRFFCRGVAKKNFLRMLHLTITPRNADGGARYFLEFLT